PEGKIRLHYRADRESRPANKILYADLEIPASRIGVTNSTYPARFRRPSAYTAIGNRYYRRDLGNLQPPGLPPAGRSRVAVLAYKPGADPSKNLAAVARCRAERDAAPYVLVLPGLGISATPVDLGNPRWYGAPPWRDFQRMIDEGPVRLAVTSILGRDRGGPARPLLLVVRPRQAPWLEEQIHQ